MNQPRILLDQAVTMRDGTVLTTDVYLPAVQPAPCVLVRTPYGIRKKMYLFLANRLSQVGFAVVLQEFRCSTQAIQDVYDLAREQQDGRDTLLWLGQQAWFDGQLALVGLSISNFSNLMLTQGLPENIRLGAMVSLMGVVNIHQMVYQNGAMRHHWFLPWSMMMSGLKEEDPHWQKKDWDELFEARPLSQLLSKLASHNQTWQACLQHPIFDEAWAPLDASSVIEQLDLPVLHLGGWHDFVLDQTLSFYRVMKARGRADQELVLGPWDHQSIFGALLKRDKVLDSWSGSLMDRIVDFLVRHIGDGAGFVPYDPVQLFVLDGDLWLRESEFPPAQAQTLSLHLGLVGDSLQLTGDPVPAGEAQFTFDPANPVPTKGGSVWPFGRRWRVGRVDQRELLERADILHFETVPLEEALWLVGPVALELYAASSAQQTDFTAKLLDLRPDGSRLILTEGIVRTRFFPDPGREQLRPANEPFAIRIDMQAVGYRLAAGARIGLELSSSNFPKYDINPNSAEPIYQAEQPQIAHQTVFFGPQMPAKLFLSLVPAQELPILSQTASSSFSLFGALS